MKAPSECRFNIPQQTFRFVYINPLPSDELLLVCARAAFRSEYDFDLNAHIFSTGGELQRKFCLGDGVYQLQTTSKGEIWAGYGDEGSFGRFGWGSDKDMPAILPRLIRWDRFGKRLYSFETQFIGKPFVDCYAMNVQNDDTVWFYYYTDFPLVRLKKGKMRFWRSPFSFASMVAVSDDYVMYYHKHKFKVCRFHGENAIRSLESVKVSPRGNFMSARGDTIVFLNDSRLYRITIADILEYI